MTLDKLFARGGAGALVMRRMGEGSAIALDPPGIPVVVTDMSPLVVD